MTQGKLRSIVKRDVEEKTLKEYFGENYDDIPLMEKQRLIDWLDNKGVIDKETDDIILGFLEEVEKRSPLKKKRKGMRAFNALLGIAFPTLIGIAATQQNWWMLGSVGFLALIYYIIYYFYLID